MAKLKCLQKSTANPPVKTLYKEGYIRVVENLIANQQNFYEFLLADPDERPDKLQTYAGKDPNNNDLVEHERADGVSELISNSNCKIVAQQDKRKKTNKPSVVTMAFPSEPPTGVDPFGYLADYAQIIHNYYVSGSTTDKQNAHKFLFGVMLMTRCR